MGLKKHISLIKAPNTKYYPLATKLTDIAIPYDRNQIFASNQNADIFIWEKDTGNLLGYIDAHQESITKLIWNNNLLYSTSLDGTVKVWRIVPVEK